MTSISLMPLAFQKLVTVLPNGCWHWDGHKMEYGHGAYRTTTAYRWAWVQVNGPVPDGLHMDHFLYPDHGCIGPACANPDHVRPVTPRENALRSDGPSARCAAKTQCDNGHEFTPENTRYDRQGKRRCIACYREWSTKHYRTRQCEYYITENCPQGHPYEQYARYRRNGSRYCGECKRLWDARPENRARKNALRRASRRAAKG